MSRPRMMGPGVRTGFATLLGVAIATTGCQEAAGGGLALSEISEVVQRDASNPTAAMDPASGATYLAWVMRDGDHHNVYLVRSEEGFGAPVRVNDQAGDAAPHEQAPAQVAVGTRGEVYVLWQNNTPLDGRRFPASDLRLAVSEDGGRSFRPAITVNDDAGEVPSSHTFHDIAVGPDGALYISWIDGRRADRIRAGLDPAPHRDPARPGAHAGHGGGDHLPGPDIRVSRSTDGGRTFEPSVVVDVESCPCCRTSLAVGPDGAVYVAWRKIFEGDVRDIVVARSAPGALRFEAPVRVHGDDWVYPGCPHAGPSLAVDAAGRLHAAWYTGREGRQGLWYSVSADGARTFGAPAPLQVGEWVPPSQVRLATEGDALWATWEERTEAGSHIAVARGDVSHGLVTLGTLTGTGRSPAIAASARGALLAWHADDAIHARWSSATNR